LCSGDENELIMKVPSDKTLNFESKEAPKSFYKN
jgi:hypothetical protein